MSELGSGDAFGDFFGTSFGEVLGDFRGEEATGTGAVAALPGAPFSLLALETSNQG